MEQRNLLDHTESCADPFHASNSTLQRKYDTEGPDGFRIAGEEADEFKEYLVGQLLEVAKVLASKPIRWQWQSEGAWKDLDYP